MRLETVRVRNRRRGASLGSALLILAVSVVLVFSLASLGTVQLRSSLAAEQTEHARNLAESALQLAIARLNADPSFGHAGQRIAVPVDASYPAGSAGWVTFNPTESGLPTSYNNLSHKQAFPWQGRAIPPETALLVAKGRCGSVSTGVECLFYRPAFPTGLITGGNVTGNGLHLTGLIADADYAGTGPLDPQVVRPADLHSNSHDAGAVTLSAGSDVSGDVSAVGQVRLDPTATVRGEVRSLAAQQALPTLNLQAVRQALVDSNVIPTVQGTPCNGNLKVDWYTECYGPLTVNGDLHLDGGVIFVHGTLTVSGEVTGRGAIIANGNIVLGKGSHLEGRDLVVMACDGNLQLHGQGMDDHYFRGLLYCAGSMEVSDLTVLGSVVTQGNARLDNVNLVQTDFSVTAAFGKPMRVANNDDVFFFYVNPAPKAGSPVKLYDYYLALYQYTYQAANDHDLANFYGQITGKDKTREEVIADLASYSDRDFQASDDINSGQVTPGSVLLPPILNAYIDALDGPASQYSVTFDLNRLLTPSQRPRILLWRNIPL